MTTTTKPVIVEPHCPSIDVDASIVRLAATCMAQLDIRYYLNGIKFEPRPEGGCYVISTDGHRMMVVIDRTATVSEECIISIPKEFLKKLPKPCASGQMTTSTHGGDPCGPRMLVKKIEGRAAVVLTDQHGIPSMAVMMGRLGGSILIEGKFPEWRRVMPDFTKLVQGCSAAYQSIYLTSVLSAFKPVRKWASVTALPWQVDKNSVITFQLSGWQNAVLLIMPMRNDAGPEDIWKKEWENARATTTRQKAKNTVAAPGKSGAAEAGPAAEAGQEPAATEAAPQAAEPGQAG